MPQIITTIGNKNLDIFALFKKSSAKTYINNMPKKINSPEIIGTLKNFPIIIPNINCNVI